MVHNDGGRVYCGATGSRPEHKIDCRSLKGTRLRKSGEELLDIGSVLCNISRKIHDVLEESAHFIIAVE